MTTQRPQSWNYHSGTLNLPHDSYTAQKLQHATPEHIHLTSRRLFIGPVPEGWLKTNRRDWYKHHLHINYSSRAATFTSSDPRKAWTRRLSGLEGPSSSALFQHSFPQPEELSAEEDNGEGGEDDSNGTPGSAAGERDDAQPLQIPRGHAQDADAVKSDSVTEYTDALSDLQEDLHGEESSGYGRDTPQKQRAQESSSQSLVTGQSRPEAVASDQEQEEASSSQVPSSPGSIQKTLGKRPVSTSRCSSGLEPGAISEVPPGDERSTTSLLHDTDVRKVRPSVDPTPRSKNMLERVKSKSKGAVGSADVARTTSNLRNLVKFDIPEDSRRAELSMKRKAAQMTIRHATTRLRRQKLKDGLIVKMERMLIRVDKAGADVPEDFDENGDQKIDSRVRDKWREYMVVCRQSISDDADFVLQLYKTRVIPEIEQKGASKRAAFEIRLSRKTTHVNLYSSLDKSVVVWTRVERGTAIYIMQARTASHAVEWYTFLRNTMGWSRTTELQISVPDLSVNLLISDPFKKLEASQSEVHQAEGSDTEEAVLRTMQQEQAVAQELIQQCLDQLKDSPEWADVLNTWMRDQRIGLAWKRYDRLEWIHGTNERRMYGTIAMQKSHELELRPKSHYPTTAVTRKKHKTLTEPLPVEGFLIRLSGQRGQATRLGLMFQKQLYFSTHNQFLVFTRPPKSAPPPPPKLPAGPGGQVPRAHTVADKTPDTWIVDPFPVKNDVIEWLAEGHWGTAESLRLRDADAEDEAERKAHNLLNCDGYINLVDVKKVRKAKWGATPVDDALESGSDVDFDEEVEDTTADDGATKNFDVERTFELVMRNGLIIRLQAANKARRKDWVNNLRALVKYWRNRIASDIAILKSTREKNLSALNIDEEGEAYIGQFAKKWEVTQSYASPELYNMCGIADCRTIHMSGLLYRKPRIHAAFTRCSVILTSGTLLIFQDVLRSGTGKQKPHIHHQRISNLDLKDCYIYSGLLTESDLLYRNQTFDANKPGHHALPRIYLEDGWTSTDEDVMTTFVVWYGKSKSWFRAEEGAGGGDQHANAGTRHKLKRVAKLGSKGRSMVFRARSRTERDHWVLAIQNEIEKAQGREGGAGMDFRIVEGEGG
ncbi:meiotically up-regulated gene 56 protein [Westerdykella ornata]|uniref:Meiotically up-regulated gene 56 protein n=1 Tax=Westerdykella ornata TaxID=318751 RepID=A0A6A6J750_WESOR|nr:meiotically up-regulated gene 56 protein [Westerdykella ornata]KAF2272017.1 meiotically up-regulated gene 56 protein [Westerdykella ornata]